MTASCHRLRLATALLTLGATACSLDLARLRDHQTPAAPVLLTSDAAAPSDLASDAGDSARVTPVTAPAAGTPAAPAGPEAGVPPDAVSDEGTTGSDDFGWLPPLLDSPIAAPSGTPTCGAMGLACCQPDQHCDEGACLRGACAPYAGFYEAQPGCGPSFACSQRNPYSAACGCPGSFLPATLWRVEVECEGGARAPRDLVLCQAATAELGAWAGAWVERKGATEQERSCVVPNATTGTCACPEDAGTLYARSDDPDLVGARRTLALCIRPGVEMLSFGGAYVPGGPVGGECVVDNPLTGECTCPEGASSQALLLGEFEMMACGL